MSDEKWYWKGNGVFKKDELIKKMKDCYICTDYGYKINRDGYTLCKQHYNEVEDLFKQIDEKNVND